MRSNPIISSWIANGWPTQKCGPREKAKCLFAFSRVMSNFSGSGNMPSSQFAEP